MDYVRHHSKPVIDRLIAWCETNATAAARAVTAIGLAYLHGLNEHQIAAARLLSTSPPAIAYPASRRRSEISQPDTTWMEIQLTSAVWLTQAASELAAGSSVGALLFRPQRRMQIGFDPLAIRRLVSEAAASGTGVRMTLGELVHSRVVAAQEAGTPLALHGLGYAPSWSARLALARPALIMPRKAR